MGKNYKKPKITTELSVGLTTESAQLVAFAANTLQIPDSAWARIAVNEKLVRDGVPQMAARMMGNAAQE